LARLKGYNSKPRIVAPQIAIQLRPGVARSRTVYRVPISPMNQYVIHDNSLANATRAVSERVFFVEKNGIFQPPPAGNRRIFWRRLKPIFGKLTGMLGIGVPLSTEQFVDCYAGRRRTIYQSAVDSLRVSPLVNKDSVIRAFVKAEKVNLTPAKPDPAPRLIQPRSPRYNVEVGVFLKPLEHKIYKIIDRIMGFGGKVVMKGLNALDRAASIVHAWDQITNPVWISLDASRFDQHVRKYALSWEHAVYTAHYRGVNAKILRRLLRQQLNNVGRVYLDDGVIKYTSDGGRASGDMNTALGNVLLMCSMLYTFIKQYRINFRMIDDGDDCGLIVSASDIHLFYDDIRPWFETMGFTMKVATPVKMIPEIEFCQTKPIFADGRWIMTRLVPNCIAKDCHTLLPLTSYKSVRNFYKSLGDCGLALASGVPVLQNFYLLYLRSSKGAKGFGTHTGLESGMLNMSKGLTSKSSIITPLARLTFFIAFGIIPDAQIAFEKYLDSIECLLDEIETFKEPPLSFINMVNWI